MQTLAPAPGDMLMSGTPLGRDLGYGPVRLHDPVETRSFRDFLAPLEADRLIARMDFPLLAQLRLYPLVASAGEVGAADQPRRDHVPEADYQATPSALGKSA